MKLKLLLALLAFCALCIIAFEVKNRQTETAPLLSETVKLYWRTLPDSSFAFRKNWEYPEGVYKNEWGQISCDGFCPDGTDAMKDTKGRIFKNSLTAFYKIVDTKHKQQSIFTSTENIPEYGDEYHIMVEHLKNNDTTFCYTEGNAATHSHLFLAFANGKCDAKVICHSIAVSENSKNKDIFWATYGHITVDSAAWHKDTLKARFYFEFDDNDSLSAEKMTWRGKIYAPISRKRKKEHYFPDWSKTYD
jgi:hypothetical protein